VAFAAAACTVLAGYNNLAANCTAPLASALARTLER
jgi:hypothetical protein